MKIRKKEQWSVTAGGEWDATGGKSDGMETAVLLILLMVLLLLLLFSGRKYSSKVKVRFNDF